MNTSAGRARLGRLREDRVPEQAQPGLREVRPSENMVGVNMVLAECHQNTLKQQIAHIFIKPCLDLAVFCQNHVYSNYVFTSPGGATRSATRRA